MEIAKKYAIRRHFYRNSRVKGTVVVYRLNADYSLGDLLWQKDFQDREEQVRVYVRALNYATRLSNNYAPNPIEKLTINPR